MLYEVDRSMLRLLVTTCLISIAFLLGSPNAVGAALQSDSGKRTSSENSPSTTSSMKPITSEQPGALPQSPGSGSQQPSSSTPAPASAPIGVTPLTPREKFHEFTRSSFTTATPYGLSVLSGVFSEAIDNDHHRHMTAGDFMADSMTHAARSMAFRTTANFLEKFAFATAFKQDPRYFRSDKKGFGRIGYAVSRVFVTQSDSGHDQFNASFFAGGLVTAGISNAWSRPEDQTVSGTMGRFGLHVAYRALSNVVKELFGKR